MNQRKVGLYAAAVVIGLAGVLISQWVMTTLEPSVALAAGYPAMLLATGLLAGLCAYFADPRSVDTPKASNRNEPQRKTEASREAEPGRIKVRKRIRLSPRA